MPDAMDLETHIQELSRLIETAADDERFRLLAKRAKAFRMKRDVRAIEDYVEIVNTARDSTLVCHSQSMLALISIEAQELKEALWWAISALNTNEKQFDGQLAVGLVLDAGELHNAAIPFFQRAVELDDSSDIALLKLAVSHREAMQFAKADDAFNVLLARSPENPKYNYECGWNWQLRNDIDSHYEHAKEFYEKALKCNPSQELRSRIEKKLESISG